MSKLSRTAGSIDELTGIIPGNRGVLLVPAGLPSYPAAAAAPIPFPAPSPAGLTPREVCAVSLLGLVFSLGVICRWLPTTGLGLRNHLDLLPTAGFLLAPFLMIAVVLREVEQTRTPDRRWLWILAAANFLFQFQGLQANIPGFSPVREIVLSPTATSYFTDARAIGSLTAWLASFHNAALHLHSATHPPGPILFYYLFWRLLGESAGALAGGCLVGVLGSCGVLAMYRFAGLWTEDVRTRFVASAVYAMLPSLVLFFPEFDQLYPVFSMLLIGCWVAALTEPRRWGRYAVILGALIFVSLFFAYHLAFTGVFAAYYGAYWIWRRRGAGSAWRAVLRSAATALAVTAGLYTILRALTGFHPVDSLRSAMAAQALVAPFLNHPYHRAVVMDPYCFVVGAGVVAMPVLLFQLRRGSALAGRKAAAMTGIGLATILTVAAYGGLGEAARVWMFLQPLVVAPFAVALAATPWRWRISVLALQWWILVCLVAGFQFVVT